VSQSLQNAHAVFIFDLSPSHMQTAFRRRSESPQRECQSGWKTKKDEEHSGMEKNSSWF
jgi:hypothetical protein